MRRVMTRTALEGLGKTLEATDEVVIEATGNRGSLVCLNTSRGVSQSPTRNELSDISGL